MMWIPVKKHDSIGNKFYIMKPMLNAWHRYFYVYRNKIRWFLSSFTFKVEGSSTPFRLDQNKKGGNILYIRSYITASEWTSFTFPNDIEAFFIGINLKVNKWLIDCSYNLNRSFVLNHLDYLNHLNHSH